MNKKYILAAFAAIVVVIGLGALFFPELVTEYAPPAETDTRTE
jgi:hypothetical protein